MGIGGYLTETLFTLKDLNMTEQERLANDLITRIHNRITEAFAHDDSPEFVLLMVQTWTGKYLKELDDVHGS